MIETIELKRTERGWAGHFCASDACLFRRNTLLECCGVKVVVSTVGNYSYKGKVSTIGVNRYYETMAFFAQDDEYNDADVSRQIWLDTNCEITSMDGLPDLRANEMHEKAVDEISDRLIKGALEL